MCSVIEPVVVEEAHEALVLGPRRERVGTPQRGKKRVKICVRAECRPVFTPSTNGELAESAEQLGKEVPQRRDDRDRPVGPGDRDVHVQAEGVVAPDDVAQQLVVSAVVRRVDDALLLPVGPRVRARRAEQETHRLGERPELRAALRHRGGHIGERFLATRPDLDLRGDELADQMLLERRSARRRLEVLEAVRQVQRLRVEDRELLLDRDREVGRRLEPSARLRDQLVRRRRAARLPSAHYSS